MHKKRDEAMHLIKTSDNFRQLGGAEVVLSAQDNYNNRIMRRSITHDIKTNQFVEVETITDKEIDRIVKQVSLDAKIFGGDLSRKLRSLVPGNVDPLRIQVLIVDMIRKFKSRFDKNQLNEQGFNKKKEIFNEKIKPSYDHFVVFLDAIKLQNILKVASMIRCFDSELLHMHDHVIKICLSLYLTQKQTGGTAAHWAARESNLRLIQIIYENGGPIDQKDLVKFYL